MKNKNEIYQLFDQVAYLLQLPTSSIWNDAIKEYNNDFIKVNNAPIYGGYKISKILKSTGECGLFTDTRYSKKEFIQQLRGIIYGLTFKK